MKIIFEDNKETPSSVLLSKSYYGNQIEFSNGAYNLSKCIEGYIGTEKVLVFVDVSPDNIHTVKTYKSLRENFSDYINKGDLFIIPILCMEYIILQSFIRYNYLNDSSDLLLQKLVVDFDYKDTNVQAEIHKKLFSSNTKYKSTLEKIFKAILKNKASKNVCIQNKFKYSENGDTKIQDDNLYGIFYTSDCNCDPKYCKLGTVKKLAVVNESLKLKAEKLFTSLPLILVETRYLDYIKELGITVNQSTVPNILQSIRMHFDKICSEMDMDSIFD